MLAKDISENGIKITWNVGTYLQMGLAGLSLMRLRNWICNLSPAQIAQPSTGLPGNTKELCRVPS